MNGWLVRGGMSYLEATTVQLRHADGYEHRLDEAVEIPTDLLQIQKDAALTWP